MLTIDDPEIERFLREEAERTGAAPVEVLRRLLPTRRREPEGTASPEEQARREAAIREIQERVAKLPTLDDRPMDELLGYDDYGLPT